MDFFYSFSANEWTFAKVLEHYRTKLNRKDWRTILDNIKKDLQKVSALDSGLDVTRRRKAQEIINHWKVCY